MAVAIIAAALTLNTVLIFWQPMVVHTAVVHRTHPRRNAQRGYVYLLSDMDGTYYKIGCTTQPIRRVSDFGVQIPYSVHYDTIIASDDMYQLETDLKRMFANKRIRGEWFDLAPEDVELIRYLARN